MKKKYGFLVTFVLMSLIFSACQKKPEPLPVLRIGHAPHDHHSPLYIAAMNPDYFREHGGVYLKEVTFREEYELVSGDKPIARVMIDSSTGGKELIRKLAEEHFDMSFGGIPAMLKFIDDGHSIQVVAPAMAEGAGFVVHKDLPVDDWKSFVEYVRKSEKPFRVGYKIAVSVQNLIFETALREEGLSYSSKLDDPSAEVTLINLHGAKHLIPALENGLIDGFVIMQPFLAMAQEKGVGKTIAMLHELPPEGKWEGNACCALAAKKSFVASHKEVSEEFITLMLRANKYIQENQEKSARQIARWLNISPEVEVSSIPTIKFTIDFDRNWEEGLDFWIDSMVKTGMLNGTVKDAYAQKTHNELIYDMELYQASRDRIQ